MLFSPIEKFDVVNLAFFKLADILDFSITNMSLYLLFVVFTIFFFFFFLNLYASFIPSFTQTCLEFFLAFIFGVLDKQIGKKGRVYFPFVFSLFLFILVANLYGIVPFSFAPTSHVTVTFFFSIMVWVMSILIGV